ncbi:WD repeat-containing protein 38 [Sinocyclocheilus anshuiensis]|uniref:WD repeat-containing protein 38 n=1 Tax=Sinocyclocheilus anshuiensis TaxID=1608454 RepID=UPI0007B78F3E|nr:PREDICTED: WD repeat-containing protein 38-like [Sinocyclocheilus anshuiensis]
MAISHEKGDVWRHPSEDFSVSNIRYFSRHKGEVNCCAFSPDCQILLTCCDDGRLYLWNSTSAKHLATFSGHSGPVKSCVFSSDGQLFASASHDRTVRIWSRSGTECTHLLTAHSGSVETVSFSPDAQWLVSGGWDNRALIWRVQSGEMVEDLRGHTAAVQSSAFSSDSQCVATGSWDRTVRVWKLLEEKEAVTLQGHLGNVACLCFSVSGMLASGSWDGTVRVWLPMRHTCLFVLGGCERVWVRSLAFSRDGLVLASTAEGDMVRIWDVTTGVCLKRLQGHKDSAYGCVFTPDGKLLTSGSEQLDVEEDEENSTEERSEGLNTEQDSKDDGP